MGKGLFYPKLALSNIRKNHSIYRPYLLAVVLLSAMYYCLCSLSRLVVESGMEGGGSLGLILGMGSWLMGVLSVLVLFYTNSFLIRRRQKEFGLYSVLGMEKRHICWVLLWEVLLVAVGGVLLGIVAGAVFSQLFLMILQRIIRFPVTLELRIPLNAVGSTAGAFALAFALVLVYDGIAVLRSRPMELLRSDRQGEREPKVRWLLAILGVVTLGGGYILALMVHSASDALSFFFPAALLVIVGTYCLFVAGSIAILKLLRRNKAFYYRPDNFLSVSTLLYRMKQNAAGLASICILSTCVLVTLSTTVCLFLGQEDMIQRMYPRMVNTSCISQSDEDLSAMERAAADFAGKCGVTISNSAGSRVFEGPVLPMGGGVYQSTNYFGLESLAMLAVPLEDYNRNAGTHLTLEPDQVYVFDESGQLKSDALQLDGWVYPIAGYLDQRPEFLGVESSLALIVVTADYETMESLANRANLAQDPEDGYTREIWAHYDFDVTGPHLEAFYQDLQSEMNASMAHTSNVTVRDEQRGSFYEMYGGLLFIGLFFVALFLIAVVLILYYKQITEGFDDHERFRILQNVGMSAREVKRVISRQVLLMFYLPLGMAALHIAVAFPSLCKILQAFQLYNTSLFALCTAGSAGVFLLFYLLTYKLTARSYFKIVRV